MVPDELLAMLNTPDAKTQARMAALRGNIPVALAAQLSGDQGAQQAGGLIFNDIRQQESALGGERKAALANTLKAIEEQRRQKHDADVESAAERRASAAEDRAAQQAAYQNALLAQGNRKLDIAAAKAAKADEPKPLKPVPPMASVKVSAATTGAQLSDTVQAAYKRYLNAPLAQKSAALRDYEKTKESAVDAMANGISLTGKATDTDKKHIRDVLPGPVTHLLPGDPLVPFNTLKSEMRDRSVNSITSLSPQYDASRLLKLHKKGFGEDLGDMMEPPAAGGGGAPSAEDIVQELSGH